MPLTVRDVMGLRPFRQATVRAGAAGLDREVLSVTAMEVPDIAPWLKGGEMIVTTGYALHQNERALIALVDKLADRNVAALAIKVGRFIERLPAEMIERAEARSLPLIELPAHLPGSDLINPIASALLHQQADLLRRGDEIHRELTRVALEGGGYGAIAETLARLVGNPVTIEDRSLRLLGASTHDGVQDAERLLTLSLGGSPPGTYKRLEEAGFLRRLAQEKKPLRLEPLVDGCRSRVIGPVLVDNQLEGYVCILESNRPVGDVEMVAAERAATLVALEMVKDRAVQEAQGRLARDFIDDLLNGRISHRDVAEERARYFGWNLNGTYAVMLIRFDQLSQETRQELIGQVKSRVFDMVRTLLKSVSPKSIAVYRAEGILVLPHISSLEQWRQDAHRLAELIQSNLSAWNASISVSVGIGSPRTDALELHRSWQEALEALQIGRRVWGSGSVTLWQGLGLYRLLSHVEPDELTAFVQEHLGPLLAYDDENGTELLTTLESYFAEDGNHVRVAERLFLHRNTVRYRLQRVEKLLNVSLDDPETRLLLGVCLRVRHLVET